MKRFVIVIGRTLLLCWLVAAVAVVASYGQGAATRRKKLAPKPPAETPVEAPPAPAEPEPAPPPNTVPVASVPDSLLQLTDWITATQKSLATSVEASYTDDDVKTLEDVVNAGTNEVNELLTSAPSLPDLREADAGWVSQAGKVSDLQTRLAARDSQLNDQIVALGGYLTLWQSTRDALATQDTPPELLDRVNAAIATLQVLDEQLKANQKRVRVLEGKIAAINTIAAGTTARLSQAIDGFQDRLVRRDSVPIWRAFSESAPPGQNVSSISSKVATAGSHVLNNRAYVVSLIVSFTVFVLAMLFVRRAALRGDGVPVEKRFPASRILLFALFFAFAFEAQMASQGPLLFNSVQKLVLLVIALALLPQLTVAAARLHITVLIAVFAANSVFDLAVTAPALTRVLILALDAAGAATMWWLGARERFPAQRDALKVLGMLLMRIGALVLAVAVVANVLGYVLLAMVLGDGVIESARTFVNAMTFFLGLAAVIAVFTRIPGIRNLATIRMRGAAFNVWTRRVLFVLGFSLWTAGVLRFFTLDKQAVELLRRILTFSISAGTVSFTVGSVIGALLVFVVGCGLATGVRFVFREEILERLPLSRGLPDAIANGIFYLMLVGVFLLSLGATGVEMSKLTVVTGALGVGIGFGLQNVVNNFVSGIILQFERPIHIDDVVELPGVKGKVSHMGIRSSTLQTFEGAEVIVPNGNLVSNQLINWTLSERRRRVDVPVGVGYGSDPEKVLQLLCDAAASHPNVMKQPGPQALFISFGDSALNFELRFWVADQDTWVIERSDVMRSIVRLFGENGIEIPFPQRDVHVRSIDPGAIPPPTK